MIQPAFRASLQLRIERAVRRAIFFTCRSGVRHLDFAQVRSFGALLGELEFRLAYVSRQRMVRDLASILEPSLGDRAAREIMRQAFRVSNAVALEMLKILGERQDERILMSQVEVTGTSMLRAAIEAGRGAILLGTHMGNSALLLICLAESGIPLSIVHREAPMMEAGFFERGIGAYGLEAILANDGLMAYSKMLSALRRNRVLYMSIDQGTKKLEDGLMLRFLGKDMPIPAGPAQLARKSKAPVFPVATVSAKPRWQFDILKPMEQSDAADLVTDLEAMLRISERLILQNPQLWSWHHRRWRHYPLATDAARSAG